MGLARQRICGRTSPILLFPAEQAHRRKKTSWLRASFGFAPTNEHRNDTQSPHSGVRVTMSLALKSIPQ
jgi:hypothetical protein